MKKRGILVAVIAVLIILIGSYFILGKIRITAPGAVTQECSLDSDCIKVQTTCCSCNMGGEERCIPKNDAGKYEDELGKCSRDIFCAAVYSCNNSECKCKEGKCGQ